MFAEAELESGTEVFKIGFATPDDADLNEKFVMPGFTTRIGNPNPCV
jgi:hypothetical protein